MNAYFINHAVFNDGDKVVVYSGHFMVSTLANSKSIVSSINQNSSNISPPIADSPLHNLVDFLHSTYQGVLISSKWRNFTGCSIPCCTKIRLNNAIWREWSRQYRHGKQALVCKFNDRLSDPKLGKNNIIFERNFRNMQPVMFRGEYNKIRKFFWKRVELMVSRDPSPQNFNEPPVDLCLYNTFPRKRLDPNYSYDYDHYSNFQHNPVFVADYNAYYGYHQDIQWENYLSPPKIAPYPNFCPSFELNNKMNSFSEKEYAKTFNPVTRIMQTGETVLEQQRREKRHLTHLKSEKHRRHEIKKWIDRLYWCVQEAKPTTNASRPSYAHILNETMELISCNREEYEKKETFLRQITAELEIKASQTRILQEMIPDETNSNVGSINCEYGKYLRFVQQRAQQNTKFVLFGLIMANTFKSFVGHCMSLNSKRRDAERWVTENVCLLGFREDSMAILRLLSKRTSIIKDPSLFSREVFLLLSHLIAECGS